MIGILIVLCVLLLYFLGKHVMLKQQIKNLSKQIKALSRGDSEKMLELSLIDKDLEHLARELNQFFMVQRNTVAGAIKHEEHLKESIANISHDLRTPLTVMMGHLQLLLKAELGIEQRQRVETALQKVNRMEELIHAFYDLSLLDTDDTDPKWENINFTNLLIDFLTENAPLLERKHIQPEIVIPDASVFINTDRNMMERILQNLLVNAIRYTSGKIKITLFAPQEGRISLTISNPLENPDKIDIERIFERFYTGDRSRHNGSTGIGLVVVKMLVEKLNDNISAKLQENYLSITLHFSVPD